MGDVAGSAVGIASLGIQVCQGLLSYYDSWKDYGADVTHARNSVSDLSATLTLLKESLEQGGYDPARTKRVESCLETCVDGLRGLSGKLNDLRKHDTPEGFGQKARSGMQRMWYPLRKDTLTKLQANVGDVRERLKLALQVLQLAIQQSNRWRKIVSWLSPPDPWSNHQSARQNHEPDTGRWLLESDRYREWKAGKIRHLWITGKAGCGKTVLCSTAIEDLRQRCDEDLSTGLAIFYFSFSDSRKKSSTDLLRSLVVQLAWREPGPTMLQQAYEKPSGGVPSDDELQKILLASLASYSMVSVVLDALDESPDDNRETRDTLFTMLERLVQGCTHVKILATSREVRDIREFSEMLQFESISIADAVVDTDIRKYVATRLAHDRKFSRIEPMATKLIEDTISSRADGMFRWAYCQLLELKKLKSTKAKYIKDALRTMPATLDETYERMLCAIEERYHAEALTLLKWLAYAETPPTLGELAEASIVDPTASGEEVVDVENRGGIEDTMDILAGLVVVFSRGDMKCGADSVSGENGDSIDDGFQDSYSDDCETLSNEAEQGGEKDIELDLDYDQAPRPDFGDNETPSTWVGTASGRTILQASDRVQLAHFSVKEYLESERILHSPATKFHLESGDGHGFLADSCLAYITFWSRDVGESSSSEQPKMLILSLLEYAARSWPYHSARRASSDVSREVAFLTSKEARGVWLALHQPDSHHKPYQGPCYPGSSLYYAAYLGFPGIVQQLLHDGADVNASGSGRFGTALQAASAAGHSAVVRMLLKAGADVNARCGSVERALQVRSSRGFHEALRMLSKVQGAVFGNALQAASFAGHENVVRILLDAGAETNAQAGVYGSALHAASQGRHESVVRLLLDAGAEINARRGLYGTALQAAAMAPGNYKTISVLLDAGAEVNATGGTYGSALSAACFTGYEGCIQSVRLLLNAGASASGLHVVLAASRGSYEIVQLLLDAGAPIDDNAIEQASHSGHEDVVQLLLSARNRVACPASSQSRHASKEGLEGASNRGDQPCSAKKQAMEGSD